MLHEDDGQFGPILPGHFDFTILFEHIFFGLVPSGFIVLALPKYLSATRSPRKAHHGPLLWAKLAVGAALVANQLASLVLWHNTTHTRTALAASIMSFVASICICAILYITHVYSAKSSAILSLFLTLTMLFDVAMARSYFTRGGLGAIGGLQVAIASLKLVLVTLDEIPKKYLTREVDDEVTASAEHATGFWNRAMFLWVTRVLILGSYKNLNINDLPHIGDEYASERLFDHFTPHWKTAISKDKPTIPLIKAAFHTISLAILAPILPRLCFIGFSFGRPFLMQRVMTIVSDGGAPASVNAGLIGAAILVFGGLMISRAAFERLEYQIKVYVRGILAVAVYDKVHKLKMEDITASAAVSLITTDVNGVEALLIRVHATWASCIELGLGIYMLYDFVGVASFLIFIPTILASVATAHTTKRMAVARSSWNEKIQTRVAATSNVLAQLKSIKAMGLSQAMAKYLQQKRVEEVESSMAERNARVVIFAIHAFGNTMAPVVVFAGAKFWTRADNPMSVSEIFTTYALILIVALPISNLLTYLPFYASGWACVLRIQKFLMLSDVSDTRQSGPEPVLEMGEQSQEAEYIQPFAVDMNHVSYTSNTTGPILRDVSIKIPRGSIAMVHGTVGSGKSALLKAMLGELPIDNGTIDVATKHIAFTDQTPWIQNLTIQDNIIGPFPFIQSIYDEVIDACDLNQDLDDLPDADHTMAGSNGCNLSGGQKQRVGLARALYSRCSIMVFDDVYSSLDPKTAETINLRLLGPNGLLRRWGTTVIMTTNRLEMLSRADNVFEMASNGSIRLQKRPSALPNKNVQRGGSAPLDMSQRVALTDNGSSTSPPPSVDTTRTNEDHPGNRRRHSDFTLYRYFFSGTNIFLFTVFIIGVIIASVLERMPQIFMRIWLSINANDNTYFAGFAGFSFADILAISVVGLQYFRQIVPKSSNDIHRDLLQSILGSPLWFLSSTDAGSLLNRCSQDIALISQQLPLMFLATLSMGFNVVVDVGIVSSGAKYAAPIIIFLIVVLYTVQHFYLKTSRQLRVLELEATSPLITHVTESSSGMVHIRSFGWYALFQREFFTRLDQAQKPYYYLFCVQQWLVLFLDLTTFIAAVTLIAIALVFPHTTSNGAIGLALLNLISFSSTASVFITIWVRLETTLGALGRIKEFCEDAPAEKYCEDIPPVSENWPATGKIDFNCVTANYQNLIGEKRQVLRNMTVSIPHGKKVCIIGRTGSGKTSMLTALLHMMEFSGSISIDNREIKSVPPELLRSQITTLTQDGVELKGSMRLNMFPFDAPMPDDDHLIGALESVGLWAYIRKNGGLGADMAALKLSHGQKQLLFIARAILHQQIMDTKIVIVDEATSRLDVEMDDEIQVILHEAFADCTVLHISHRRDSAENFDMSIELDSGDVLEVLQRDAKTGRWVPADD